LEAAENIEAKERIINASVKLFSQKGFDATRVNEIAEAANVNKALIYYYFKNKEDILDYLVQSFVNNIRSMAWDFIHTNIIHMVNEGRLKIESDRLSFVNKDAIECFLQNFHIYYEQVIDYAIQERLIIRILMLESLKNSKHRNDLFQLLDITNKEITSMDRSLGVKDITFNYTDDMVLFKFFFSVIPLVCFVAYYDDYKLISSLSDKELRDSFLRAYQIIITSFVSGSDMLLQNKIQ